MDGLDPGSAAQIDVRRDVRSVGPPERKVKRRIHPRAATNKRRTETVPKRLRGRRFGDGLFSAILRHDRAGGGQPAFEIVLRGSVRDGMGIHAALIALRTAKGQVEAADIAWRPRTQHGASVREAPHTRLEAGRR